MAPTRSSRRVPHHRPMLHRPPRRRDLDVIPPARTSDLALLGVVPIGGLAPAAAFALARGDIAP